jgi:alkylhydroperoxidase/carboxymuconolactone decarboxylase family protein YurZ
LNQDKSSNFHSEAWEKESEKLVYRKMFGAMDPFLLKSWNEFYKNLILKVRDLDLISKELILLCLLTYTKEANGRIHISRAKEAGVTEMQMTSAISLAGAFSAFNSYDFLSENWSKELRLTKVLESYLRGVEQSRGELDHKLCEIMGIACHASKRSFKGMQLHLKRAFSLKAKVSEVSEALSYLIMVSSVPTLTDAVLEWSEMADKGLCPPPFTDIDS